MWKREAHIKITEWKGMDDELLCTCTFALQHTYKNTRRAWACVIKKTNKIKSFSEKVLRRLWTLPTMLWAASFPNRLMIVGACFSRLSAYTLSNHLLVFRWMDTIIKKTHSVLPRWSSRYILLCFGNSTVSKNSYAPAIKSCSARPFSILREVITRIFAIIVHPFNIPSALGFVIRNTTPCLPAMTIRNSKLTRVSGPEFVCHHTLYDTLDIPGVRVTCTVVNGRFINYIVRRVTCLLIYIDCFIFLVILYVRERRKHTWRTLRARRISPRDNLRIASRPSSVRFTLQAQAQSAGSLFSRLSFHHWKSSNSTHPSFCTTSSTLTCISFSGKGENLNLVHRDWIAGVILLT